MGSLRIVATVAAVSFLTQGVVWVVLTVLGIFAYTCHFEPKEDMSNNPTFSALAKYYFSDTNCWSWLPDRQKVGITSSDHLIMLISFQFTFNVLIVIVSLILLFVIPRKSTLSFLGWLYSFMFLALAISVADMVAAATFSGDKDLLMSGSTSSEMAPLTSMLQLVSMVAARGFLYWVLNVLIIFYIFITATLRLFKACRKLDDEKNMNNGHINGGFEEDERGLPSHTAMSRWPALGRSLWRDHRQSRRQTRERWGLDAEERDRAGFGTREELQQRPSFRDAFNYMQPKKTAPIRQLEVEQRRENGSATGRVQPDTSPTRPNSLQEAILTIKPLKQVRPKIPDMLNRY